MGIESGATKRMWLARWNAFGNAVADAFDGDLSKSKPFYLLANAIAILCTMLKYVCFAAFLPVVLAYFWSRDGANLGEKFVMIILGATAGTCGWMAMVAVTACAYDGYSRSTVASPAEITRAMGSSPCMKDYVPRYLKHINSNNYSVNKVEVPLTLHDLREAASICQKAIDNGKNVKAQRAAMEQAK